MDEDNPSAGEELQHPNIDMDLAACDPSIAALVVQAPLAPNPG